MLNKLLSKLESIPDEYLEDLTLAFAFGFLFAYFFFGL